MKKIVESITYGNSTLYALLHFNDFEFCIATFFLFLKQTLRLLLQERSLLRVAVQRLKL